MATISLFLSEWGWRNKTAANFYLAPTRAWELFSGSIAAFIVQKQGVKKNNFLAILGLFAIIFSIFAYDKTTPFPSVYALVPVIGVMLLILYANKETLTAKLLGTRLFVGIGLISYSAYLWHQPLFAFAKIRLIEHSSMSLMFALSLISILLAYLSWRFIEKPFRNKVEINRSKVFIFSTCGVILFSAFGILGIRSDGFVTRFSSELSALYLTSMAQFENNVQGCWSKIESNPSIESGCVLGAKEADTSFALLGDSHAATLITEIDRIALEAGISGISLTSRGCPPVKNIIRVPFPRKECSAIRQEIFKQENISKLPKNIIVMARWPLLIERERYTNSSGYKEVGNDHIWRFVGSDYYDYSTSMQNEIEQSLEYFLNQDKNLIIVYPIPELGWEVPQYLANKISLGKIVTNETGSTSFESYISRTKSSYEVLDKIGVGNDVLRIYPSDYSCDSKSDLCLAHLKLQPLYFDDDHLTELGARPIANHIINSLLELKDTIEK
jgi:hypothetical protein